MSIEWKGIFPALTTKFTEHDTLDNGLFLKNLTVQLDAGIDGIILGGTLGEASTLTFEEKKSLVQTTISHVSGKIPVILNIAEGSTREAIRQAAEAEAWGISGLMLLPPMRYYSDHRETVAFF